MLPSEQQRNESLNKNIKELTKEDIKNAIGYGVSEIVFHIVFYFLVFTTTGLYFLIGFWSLVGLIPIGLMAYYLFKKK